MFLDRFATVARVVLFLNRCALSICLRLWKVGCLEDDGFRLWKKVVEEGVSQEQASAFERASVSTGSEA